MARLRYLEALRKALRDEMLLDESVFVLGEDVEVGTRGLTTGLLEEFGSERVKDTPISEAGFVGFATGAAMEGRRPVVEFQINTMVFQAFDQIVNNAAKFHLMSGGGLRVPVTYIFPASGAALGNAAQHSDHPYSYLLHAGVKTVVPAMADDAYGLLVTAIRDDDPVAVFSPALIQGRRAEVPDGSHLVPLGVGRVHREGTDVTVVAVGPMVSVALKLAGELAEQGVSIEVWDPRTLLPLDHDGLARSVEKTGRLVIFDDSNRTCGFAAEVAAFSAQDLYSHLRAPIQRVTRADVPISYSLPLEAAALPRAETLEGAVRAVIE